MDNDPIAGAATEAKGAIKEALGRLTGDAQLQAEGKADTLAAEAQNAVDGVKNTARDPTNPDET